MALFVEQHAGALAALSASVIAGSAAEWGVAYRERRGSRGTRRVAAGAALVELAAAPRAEDAAEGPLALHGLVGSMLLGLVLAVAGALGAPGMRLPGGGWLWAGAGSGLVLAGGALRAWAVAVLGRGFRRDLGVAPGHAVVACGPYRLVRHPAYLGNLLVALGVGVALGSVASVAALVALPLLGHLPRIAAEERALRRLGEPYERYAAHRARLLPRVW